MIEQVSSRQFIDVTRELNDVWPLFRDNIEFPIKFPAKCYLSGLKLCGFAVGDDGELRSLFSIERGKGEALVKAAVSKGATWLTCFDNGYLVELYMRCGFDVVTREKNWFDGKPDVVRMAWRQ